MAEVTASAYSDLRTYISSNWQYIELQNEVGTKILRINTTDPRVTSVIEGNIVKFTVVIKGTDTDIIKPVTFAQSSTYKVATGGSAFTVEPFAPFTIEGDNDELTIIHEIQVPKIV